MEEEREDLRNTQLMLQGNPQNSGLQKEEGEKYQKYKRALNLVEMFLQQKSKVTKSNRGTITQDISTMLLNTGRCNKQ